MKLSDLKTGQRGVIVKVTGHGGFRKRIVEMGFIKGKVVDVLQNAPLQDPVKYKIMGYEVSLRHSEAEMIEVVSEEEAAKMESQNETAEPIPASNHYLSDTQLRNAAMKKRRTINVALIGNPNCGKTSLFNFASGAHERVGNYSGVTVDAKVGHASFEGYEFNIVDLPGTYSLSAYSPEELYVRKQIIEHTPDVIINVIDASNLERNLYLTTQLIDMNLRMVCALNMFDETEKRGDNVDYTRLGQLFGVPMIPTTFTTGRGVELLFHIIINMYEGLDFLDTKGNMSPEIAEGIRQWHEQYDKDKADSSDHEEDFASGIKPKNNVIRHIHINHGQYVEAGINSIQAILKEDGQLRHKYSTRYLAIKLLEKDKEAVKLLDDGTELSKKIFAARDKAMADILEYTHEDSETAIMDAKYGFIHGALKEAGYKTGDKKDTYFITHLIDNVITNKYVGFPIFLIMIWVMFEATFSLGQYPMEWIESLVEWIGSLVSDNMPQGPIKDMLVDGVIGGVGSVIVFLPQILILYFFISFMEDSGYMARVAFVMDKLLRKIGLSGRSFVPMLIGFGCSVPAIMSTRTLSSERDRKMTILLTPFMSCSAKLPIYSLIISVFFPRQYQALVMVGLYIFGIICAIIYALILKSTKFKGEPVPFVMELPNYRLPSAKSVVHLIWEKAKGFIEKAFTIIFVASIIIWFLQTFDARFNVAESPEQSLLAMIGSLVAPIFAPLGFGDWRVSTALITGFTAKESVVSTLTVLMGGNAELVSTLFTPFTAAVFLVFTLLYTPCVAAIATVKREMGGTKAAVATVIIQCAIAWCVAFLIHAVGLAFGLA